MLENECHTWKWEEAFDKFGFNDGAWTETWQVVSILEDEGYVVEISNWGIHNAIIVSIKKGETELIPHDDPDLALGYTNPRVYLPDSIIKLLDKYL